jgi:hypothetical protein
MSQKMLVEIEMPPTLEEFKLPRSVNERLQYLLDRQDQGQRLTESERAEALGLVDLAEFLTLLKLRARKVWPEAA